MEGRALQLVEMSRSMAVWLILQCHTSIIFSFLDSDEVDDKSRNMWLYYGPRLNLSLQLRLTQRKRRHTGFPYCQIGIFFSARPPLRSLTSPVFENLRSSRMVSKGEILVLAFTSLRDLRDCSLDQLRT